MAGELSGEFYAWDLTALGEQVDEFVDLMLQRGVRAWVCHYWCTTESVPGQPDRLRWHASVQENTAWLRRPRV